MDTPEYGINVPIAEIAQGNNVAGLRARFEVLQKYIAERKSISQDVREKLFWHLNRLSNVTSRECEIVPYEYALNSEDTAKVQGYLTYISKGLREIMGITDDEGEEE